MSTCAAGFPCSDYKRHDVTFVEEAWKVLLPQLRKRYPDKTVSNLLIWSDGSNSQFKLSDSFLSKTKFAEW
jgi:hypothetical protein